MEDSVSAVLADLLGQFDEIPTLTGMEDDWDKQIEAGEHEGKRANLRRFIRVDTNTLLEAVNLPFLKDLAHQVQMSINKLPELTFEEMRMKNQEPTTAEINQAITNIYSEIQTLQKYKEECMHYIGVFKHAVGYLKTWKKACHEFIMDEDLCDDFINRSERERFSSRMTTDTESYIQVLTTNIRDLTEKIDKILQPRQNMLLRADSALRLLAKFMDIEKSPGWLGGDTEVPGGADGFSVEKM